MTLDHIITVPVTGPQKAEIMAAGGRNRRSEGAEVRARLFGRSRALADGGEEFREIAEALADDVREEDATLAGLLDAVVEHLEARENEAKGATYAHRNPKTPAVSERLKASSGEG